MQVNDLLEERLFGMLVRYTSEPTARGILQRARRGQHAKRGHANAYFDMVMPGATRSGCGGLYRIVFMFAD